MKKCKYLALLLTSSIFFWLCDDHKMAELTPGVEVEEIVYEYEPADNGADPMWCRGNTCIVRHGDEVFASGLETIRDAIPLNNTRWLLFKRSEEKGWQLLLRDEKDRTREPCPLGIFPDGRLFLSVYPTHAPLDAYNGRSEPRILQFETKQACDAFETSLPEWDGQPEFSAHSYRSFAIDGREKEMILFVNNEYTHAEWSFFDKTGKWVKHGKLTWPWGADYSEPQPIRVCYPAVQFKNRAVYFLGVSDIKEPNKVWKDYKFKLTGREWDYDFRRLFYTWTPDITTGYFNEWVELASREKTAGHIFPCDLWAAPNGMVHVLWIERALDERLRKDFFPKEEQTFALNYALIQEGKKIFQQPVMFVHEKENSPVPGNGRFHVTPNNRLFIFYYISGTDEDDNPVAENRIIEVRSDRTFSAPLTVPLRAPLSTFFTNTVRGGNSPSFILDVLGSSGTKMHYTRIRLE